MILRNQFWFQEMFGQFLRTTCVICETDEFQKYFRTLKPRLNEQALFGKHSKFCLLSNACTFKAPAKRTNIVWQTFEVLFVKQNVCWFGHYTNTCLTNILCQAKNVFWTFQKHWQAKCACQAMFVVVAKRASMFDEQNSKCLANNVCPFGRGFSCRKTLCDAFIKLGLHI